MRMERSQAERAPEPDTPPQEDPDAAEALTVAETATPEPEVVREAEAELACRECGTPLTRGKAGRPPTLCQSCRWRGQNQPGRNADRPRTRNAPYGTCEARRLRSRTRLVVDRRARPLGTRDRRSGSRLGRSAVLGFLPHWTAREEPAQLNALSNANQPERPEPLPITARKDYSRWPPEPAPPRTRRNSSMLRSRSFISS